MFWRKSYNTTKVLLQFLLFLYNFFSPKFFGHICSVFCTHYHIKCRFNGILQYFPFVRRKRFSLLRSSFSFFHLIKFCCCARLNCFYLFHNLYCIFILQLSLFLRRHCSKIYLMGNAQTGFEVSFRRCHKVDCRVLIFVLRTMF